MAKPEKIVVPDKVRRDKNNNKKFKIEKGNQPNEVDIEIDILGTGNYDVDKLKVDDVEKEYPQMPDGKPIRWLNNFSIKQNGRYIQQTYKVTVPGLSKRGDSILVIYSEADGLYPYDGKIEGDTFELSDGDPATGMSP
jgi:hypothetical protein